MQDALYELGFDGSFASRCKIANKNGIAVYIGTFNQNVNLFNLFKSGLLKK